MYRSLLSLLALASATSASPVAYDSNIEAIQNRAAAPTVTLRNGTVTGKSSNGIESFNGIPYAQQPVGDLRLRRPQTLIDGFYGGTYDASGTAGACPQFVAQVGNLQDLPSDILGTLLNDSPLLQVAINETESCLTIDVQRPAGTKPGDKLPVVFWIFGGGFELGWSSMYDGSNLIQSGVNLDKPVIFVAVNYRVNGFGFLAGKELAAEGNTNLGLRDQRKGLEWVAENIDNFGGDPDKVVIWGESAGSISVFDHLIINDGDNTYNGKALFRGAIMNSGTIIPAADVSSVKPQAIYDTVVASSPCAGVSDSLSCLRGLDYNDFLNAVTSVPGIFAYSSIDLSYLPRPDAGDSFFPTSPESPVLAGRYARVPIIVGDQEDEGTLFSLVQANTTTNDDLITYLTGYFAANNPNARELVTGLAATYPDQPGLLLGQPAGSPYRTGALNNLYPQYKRLAAILGDITFTLTRRATLSFLDGQGIKAWSYLSSYLYGTPVLGTLHGSDILFIFFSPSNSSVPTRSIHTYYTNFFYNLDPNDAGNAVGPIIPWPQWTGADKKLLTFNATGNGYGSDTFRSETYEYLKNHTSDFRI